MIKQNNKDKWTLRGFAALRLHSAWLLKHSLETGGSHPEPLASPCYCVSITRSGRKKKKNSEHLEMQIPFPPTNNFRYPGWANSDACHVDFSLWLPLRLSASLCSSSCSVPQKARPASFMLQIRNPL